MNLHQYISNKLYSKYRRYRISTQSRMVKFHKYNPTLLKISTLCKFKISKNNLLNLILYNFKFKKYKSNIMNHSNELQIYKIIWAPTILILYSCLFSVTNRFWKYVCSVTRNLYFVQKFNENLLSSKNFRLHPSFNFINTNFTSFLALVTPYNLNYFWNLTVIYLPPIHFNFNQNLISLLYIYRLLYLKSIIVYADIYPPINYNYILYDEFIFKISLDSIIYDPKPYHINFTIEGVLDNQSNHLINLLVSNKNFNLQCNNLSYWNYEWILWQISENWNLNNYLWLSFKNFNWLGTCVIQNQYRKLKSLIKFKFKDLNKPHPQSYLTMITLRYVEFLTNMKSYFFINFDFYSFLDSLELVQLASSYLKLIRTSSQFSTIFFLDEFLDLFYMFFKIKDSTILIDYLQRILESLSIWDHKKFFIFIFNVFKEHFYPLFKKLNVIGLKLIIKGKVGVTGNSRKRSVKLLLGETSISPYFNSINFSNKFLNTNTGVLGLQIWLIYKI